MPVGSLVGSPAGMAGDAGRRRSIASWDISPIGHAVVKLQRLLDCWFHSKVVHFNTDFKLACSCVKCL